MNILLLCYEYPPVGGGGGVGAQQYAEAWASNGHEVTVLTSRANGLAFRERVNAVDVIRVSTFGLMARAISSLPAMLYYNITGFIHVLLHRKRFKRFDVINTHFSIPTGLLGWAARRFLGVPNVLTIIGGDIYDPSKKSSPHRHAFLRFCNRRIINAADRVLAISSDTKKRAEQYYAVEQPIRVINYGFKPTANSSSCTREFDPTKYYLIAVGRLVRRKGFDVLVRAMAHLPEDVALLLVGDGPLEQSLRNLAAQEGVSRRVHLLGYQTPERIHDLLRKSDCFVLSSLHEGLGIVVQEAMDAGLPVVATDNGGQVDLIKHLHNGMLVGVGDTEALAGAIRALYEDRALGQQMGRNNLAAIKPLHIEKNNRLYINVFEEVVGIRATDDEPQVERVDHETRPVRAGSSGI